MKKSIIALVDCDSFFVSCEQSLDESLIGKPVCVLSNNDACVIARSKEAKELGITMGMPYYMAKKKFPEGIYVSGDIHKYKVISKKIMAILREFSPEVEVYSIDEAFVELRGLRKLYKANYFKIAQQIRQKILDELSISVSIGISNSKVLAKLACEIAKNDEKKVYVINKAKIPYFLKTTKVEEIWGIGKNSTKLFNRWGVLICEDLVKKSDEWLKTRIGKRGVELKHELLGETIDAIKPKRKLPQSIQNTRSFPKPTNDIDYIKNALNVHIHTSCTKLRYLGGKCNSVCVMLRTKDFITYWEKKQMNEASNFELEISKTVMKLLKKMYSSELLYRSCGVTLEDLDFETEGQLNLFGTKGNKNYEKLAKAIDNLEKKFGKNIIKTGFMD